MLEIHVSDQIKVFDSFKEASDYVLEEIRRWYISDDKSPLTIELVKKESTGPPSISINVTESIKTKTVFG